jgi:8-oxo-dGTP diphosphatase
MTILTSVFISLSFECAIDKSKITLFDHKKIVWKSAKDLKTLDWAEADLPVVNLLYHQEKLNKLI